MAVPLDLPHTIERALARAMGQIDRVLARAVQTGADARDVATRIGRFLSPRFAARRNASGEVVRGNVRGVLGDWPASSGAASAGVRAIAETEINTAHGDAATVIAQRTPGLGVQWLLAPLHEAGDDCDGYASADNGFGPGVYLPTDVPPYPVHPRCQCQLLTVPLS
jgi:hypothetical protein